jgi:tricorn protease-like protein
MSLLITCPGCQKPLRLADAAPEQTVRCPRCGISFDPANAVPTSESAPPPKRDDGISGRPMPPVSPAPESRFDPDDPGDRPPIARSSSKVPLILLLVIGLGILFVGAIAVFVVVGAMFFWVSARSTSPSASVAPVDRPVEEVDVGMRPIQHDRWEQNPLGGPGGMQQFDPFLPIGCVDVSGPDDKGRLGFYTSRTVVSVAFLDEGKTLVAGSNDGEVRLWDLEPPPKRKSVIPPGRKDGVTDIAIAPDGKSYVTVNHGGAVQIMDIATKQEKAVLSGSEQAGPALWAVAYRSDGKTIATAHGNDVVKLWDVPTEKLRATLHKQTGQVTSLAFSRDGNLLASGAGDTTVVIWNVAEERDVAVIKAPGAANTAISALAFAPDGNSLAFGGNDNLIHLWDLKKKEERAVCRHLRDVTSAAFSPDGKLLASTSSDGTIRVWDGVTGERRALLQSDTNGPVRGLAFSPDCKKLAVGCNGVQLWDLTKVEMLK